MSSGLAALEYDLVRIDSEFNTIAISIKPPQGQTVATRVAWASPVVATVLAELDGIRDGAEVFLAGDKVEQGITFQVYVDDLEGVRGTEPALLSGARRGGQLALLRHPAARARAVQA